MTAPDARPDASPGSVLMSGPSKIANLMAAADKAYDAENVAWFEALPTEDLTALWGVACASISGASWDDEVFDALDRRGWFETETTEPAPRHLGGGANAEDCPACRVSPVELDYPWTCPGEPATRTDR